MDSATATPFCNGQGGMVMYMDGFRFGLAGGNQPCLNLYFAAWTLDTRGKFIGALFGVFFLAIAVEGVSKLRQWFVLTARRKTRQPTNAWNKRLVRGTVTLLHGFQAFVGYILMLATMTYSAEFLLAIVFGLGCGYMAFFRSEDDYLTPSAHVTANPCCNFMAEEAKEEGIRRSIISTDAVSSVSQSDLPQSETPNNV